MTYANILSGILYYALISYGLCTLVVLLTLISLKRLRKRGQDYLNVSNAIIAIICVLAIILTTYNHVSVLTELKANNMSIDYPLRQLVISVLLFSVAPLVFMFRKMRKSIIVSFFAVFLVNWTAVKIMLALLYGEYVPESISFSSPMFWLFSGSGSVIYFAMVIAVLRVRKDTRYRPSATFESLGDSFHK